MEVAGTTTNGAKVASLRSTPLRFTTQHQKYSKFRYSFQAAW